MCPIPPSLLCPAEMEPVFVSPGKVGPLSGEVLEPDAGVPKPQHMLWHVPTAQLAGASEQAGSLISFFLSVS